MCLKRDAVGSKTKIAEKKTPGEKRQYSFKKQVSTTKGSRIIGVFKTYPGMVHSSNA